MKSYKTSKRIIYMVIAFIMTITWAFSSVYATEVTPTPGVALGPSEESTNLPYIEMKVKSVKVGTSNQIRIECWGSNFTKLEGAEIVFTYNSTKLTPSNVSNNEIIESLDSIKKAPTQADETFNKKSTQILAPAFQFNDEYKDILGIKLFKFLAADKDSEALQFVIAKTNYLEEVNATEPILLGTFSFKQTDETILEENEFATKRIKVMCDDGLGDEEDGFSYYTREETNGEDCTEIVEFTYEKYGSISGEISAQIDTGSRIIKSKNITMIEIYKKADIDSIDFTKAKYFESLPEPYMIYTTTEEENGKFKVENIEFGEYVILIDKEYYSDYIIKNLTINSENKDINFSEIENIGIIQLIPGDINRDGKINSNDTLLYNKDVKEDKIIDFNDTTSRGKKNDSNDILMYNAAYKNFDYRKTKQEVKKIVECE